MSLQSPGLGLGDAHFDLDVESVSSGGDWDANEVLPLLDVRPDVKLDVKPAPAPVKPAKPLARRAAPTKPKPAAAAKRKSVASGSRRLHACTWCPKKFVTTGHLKQHVRIHTGDRPFKCTWCEKAFAQCGDLKRHERIHTGEKPFECKTCGKAFAQCGNLKKHERIHTRDKSGADSSRKNGKAPRGQSQASPAAVVEATVPAPTQTASAAVGGAMIALAPPEPQSSPAPPAEAVAVVPSEAEAVTAPRVKRAKVEPAERPRKPAREGRLRKKEYVGALEAKVMNMEARDEALRAELDAVRAQLVSLQSEHELLLEVTGRKRKAPGSPAV